MRWWLVLVGFAMCGGCSCGSETEGSGRSSGGPGGTGGGGQGGGAQVVCIPGLESIALSPADSVVQIDGVSAAPITFTATGTVAGGAMKALDPAALTWSVSRDDDTPPGTISSGVLQPYPSAGGTVRVTVTDGCVTGETTVVLHLDAVVGAPSDPDAWADGTLTVGAGPNIVYPSDRTRFPRNLYRTLFQWRAGNASEFRLTFTGAASTVTVYTDGAHGACERATPRAGCWEVDEVTWRYIAASNAGSTATWTVDALDTSTSPPSILRSDALEIGFSKQDVEGAIFYWSTTSAGVRRGKISRQAPEDYIVGKPPTTYSDGDRVKCVACHVVSRDGKYMAAPVSANSGNSLWILDVTASAPPEPLVKSVEDTDGHGFATISPDDARVVAAWKGKMWMVDRETGAKVNDLPTDRLGGTHPDWSPLGTSVVFVTGSGDAPSGSSLALIPYDAGAWGQASVFLAPPSGKSNLFPIFSPDAAWIAFSQGKGGHSDDTAQLMVIAANGTQPVELVNANRVTSNRMTDGQYQNSQPTWAPPGDYNWIAFNTKREYGVVSPEGTQQIWVAAIDVKKAEQGEDPSYPAFRVPFQGLDENNHRAYWTLDVNDGSGGGGSGGGSGSGAGGSECSEILRAGAACDPLNDCCESGSYCDTADSGETYVCSQVIR